MKRAVLFASIALLVGASAYAESLGTLINDAGLRPLKEGTQSINFRLDDLQGHTVSLSSYKGSVVLLNFWATWCGPCRSEMGSIETLYSKFKNKGLVVLAVNLQESPSSVQPFVKQFGLTFPVLLDRSGQVALTYGARGIPTSYLINRKGDVTSGIIGTHDWSSPQTYKLVQALLSGN